MTSRIGLWVLTFFFVGTAVAEARDLRNVDDLGQRVRKLLGDKVADVVVHAERAEISRLDDERPGYPPIGKARPLDVLLFKAFRAAILDSDIYTYRDLPPGLGTGKGCGAFRPGVAVRFWAEAKGRSAYVDALLCFHCSDIAFVAGSGGAQARLDMASGEQRLLRLASAALPEDVQLARLLSERGDYRTREALFVSMFPPRAQAALAEVDQGFGASVSDEAARLASSLSGPELVAAAARAFGARQLEWITSDKSHDIVVQAVERVSSADVRAGLKAIASDQVALAGAAELLVARGAFERSLAEPERQRWLPILAEAAVVQMPHARLCSLMTSLRNLPANGGRPLLMRIAKGQLSAAPKRWSRTRIEQPSARGCALVSLAHVDPSFARDEARAWAPADPLDQAAVRIVTGEASAQDEKALRD
jgi:hypothetical protein